MKLSWVKLLKNKTKKRFTHEATLQTNSRLTFPWTQISDPITKIKAHPLYLPTSTTWSNPSTQPVPVNSRLSLLIHLPSESWKRKRTKLKGKMTTLQGKLLNFKNNYEMPSWQMIVCKKDFANFRPRLIMFLKRKKTFRIRTFRFTKLPSKRMSICKQNSQRKTLQ